MKENRIADTLISIVLLISFTIMVWVNIENEHIDLMLWIEIILIVQVINQVRER